MIFHDMCTRQNRLKPPNLRVSEFVPRRTQVIASMPGPFQAKYLT